MNGLYIVKCDKSRDRMHVNKSVCFDIVLINVSNVVWLI